MKKGKRGKKKKRKGEGDLGHLKGIEKDHLVLEEEAIINLKDNFLFTASPFVCSWFF